MRLVSQELFIPSPGRGTIVFADAYYTRLKGLELVRHWHTQKRSDTASEAWQAWSADNGRTWSDPQVMQMIFRTLGKTIERGPGPALVDPVNGRLLTIMMEVELPEGVQPDDPRQSQARMYPCYSVSQDGGRTALIDEQIVQKGHTPANPFDGVYVGRNSMLTCSGGLPIRTRDGRILVTVQIFPLGPDGKLYNPGGGFTWQEGAVLIGTWRGDRHLDWDLSQRLVHSPDLSTRGYDESTLAEMPDGRLLQVIRGSNDARLELPGRKWASVSRDGGYTWSAMKPWMYDDGEAFFSPASCSQFLPHSSGRLFWIGNICPANPRGNHPRHPLVIGEVDTDSLTLRRDTVTVLLARQADQHELIQFSNFLAREDRETGEIVIHMSPIQPLGPNTTEWTGDAMLYRVEV